MTQPPTPPPDGGSKPPDFGEMGQKLRGAEGPDRLILIAGALFFIDSFLPWFRIRFLGFSGTASGWSYGGVGLIAILCAIAATGIAVAGVAGMKMGSSKQTGQLLLGLSGGALVFAVIRWLTHPSLAAFGLYIAIVLGAIMTYASYQKFTASN
jgi:hypothetical protein